MTNSHDYQAQIRQDRYALKIAARLNAATKELPHDIGERLRVARTQAVARCKVEPLAGASSVLASGRAATLGRADEGLNWWNRIAAALPLLALAIGLVAINAVQSDNIARELAVLDAALLVDDLPPAAYADPGFAQFIKVSNTEAQ